MCNKIGMLCINFNLDHRFLICWITFDFKEFQSAAIGKNLNKN